MMNTPLISRIATKLAEMDGFSKTRDNYERGAVEVLRALAVPTCRMVTEGKRHSQQPGSTWLAMIAAELGDR
jgi:hypothetical protein